MGEVDMDLDRRLRARYPKHAAHHCQNANHATHRQLLHTHGRRISTVHVGMITVLAARVNGKVKTRLTQVVYDKIAKTR
jgi:hypothetical protein